MQVEIHKTQFVIHFVGGAADCQKKLTFVSDIWWPRPFFEEVLVAGAEQKQFRSLRTLASNGDFNAVISAEEVSKSGKSG